MTHKREKRKAMEEVYLCDSGGSAGGVTEDFRGQGWPLKAAPKFEKLKT